MTHYTYDLEMLARMAARLAGRDPDCRITIRLGDVLAFDDAAWRYPDFLARAKAAYAALIGDLPVSRHHEIAGRAVPGLVDSPSPSSSSTGTPAD